MAKLPRLMEQGPPQFVDPKRLAENRDEISGILDIAGMQRLEGLLSKNTGSVSFELLFNRDEHGRICVSGNYKTELCMQCQRCLLPVDVKIDKDVNVTLVADEEEATRVSRDIEPLVLTDKKLSLLMFFEDELLLAIPLAPNHEVEDCHVEQSSETEIREETQRPFAVLKDLKLKSSKD
ncbi:MAG: hypothetical protein HN764_00260 [Gammaproteobacteria bacterium]|nr:hypothetical protein [Gammaproteobacteria bacterium]